MKKLFLIFCLFPFGLAASPNDWRDHSLKAMGQELDRSFKHLRAEDFEPPYYLAYALQRVEELSLTSSFGALTARSENRYTAIRTDLRVGSPAVDNTQPGEYPGSGFYGPVDDRPLELRTAFWQLTDGAFKAANERLNQKRAWLLEHAEEKDRPDDFSPQTAVQAVDDFKEPPVLRDGLEGLVQEGSAVFKGFPDLQGGQVRLTRKEIRKLLADSEGTRVAGQEFRWSLNLETDAQAGDGAPLSLALSKSYVRQEDLPGLDALKAMAGDLAGVILKQRMAPQQEPYTGPVLLSGEAAGVFLHEVLGHRLEGERQKDEKEGQTFKDKVGKKIMAGFVSVEDDPTLKSWGATPLNGYYRVDDQGVPARKARLVENGKLAGFLMSRAPIKGFAESNGHGRCDAWHGPCGRMGNLILRSRIGLDEPELFAELQKACRRQGLPYGLYIKRIQGGDTLTVRGDSQSFRGIPLEVYRVDAGDGSRTLVRGVEIVGTPLNALTKIVAAGRESEVFNGVCGAGSGWVYVSAVSPALLISELEVQGQKDQKSRPRILPPPFASEE
jgi:predicted Zn-dependent protease